MKTTKRVLAIVLAVMMLALAIPFAASAATAPQKNVNITLSHTSNQAYTYDIYQLATLDFEGDTTTGTYTTKTSIAAINDIIKAGVDTAAEKTAFLNACDDNYASIPAAQKIATFNADQDNKSFTKSVAAGIYYIHVTPGPDTNATLVTNSVFALPYYDGTDWINSVDIPMGQKIADNTPTIDKTVKRAEDTAWSEAISEELGKTFQFRIVSKVTGSSDQQVAGYRIYDEQDAGLTFGEVTSVKLLAAPDATTGTDITAYTTTKMAADDDTLPAGATFAVYVEDTSKLYTTANAYVEVIYTATVNKNAKIASANNNKATLQWEPKGSSSWTTGPNDDAKVFTYDISVVKVDANATSTKLSGAKFMIFDTQAKAEAATKDSTNFLAVTGTDNNGTYTFKKTANANDKFTFKAGTYYIKEVVAPEGYNLSTVVTQVEIGADTATATSKTVTITNAKSILPKTGGPGTVMFYVIGASLIICAGALLVVVMKKRAK